MQNKQTFLDYLSNNANIISEILYCSILATPLKFNDREYRMLTDQIPRRQLYIQLPNIFKQLENKTGDILFIPTNEAISMKKGNDIFPKLKKSGNGYTKPVIQLINSLGNGSSRIFNADFLLAYQPQNKNTDFILASLAKNKIESLMFKKGDQWQLQLNINDWDFFQTFKFKDIKIDNNNLFIDTISKFYDEAYLQTRKIYDI